MKKKNETNNMEEDVINIWKKLGGAILAIDKHTKKISNNTKRIKKLEGQGGKK